MYRKRNLIVTAALFAVLSLPAAEPEPELFRITEKDRGMISEEFIRQIRAGVGDEKASYASDELDDFVHRLMGKARNRMDYEDVKCCYLNYLERLHDKALRAAAAGLSPRDRAELLRREEDWQKNGCTDYDYEITGSDGRPAIDVEPRDRAIRLYLNRTRYLESPPARRAELDRFHGLRVPYVRGDSLPLEYHELRRVTPLDVLDSAPQTRGKTYVEDIATLPPEHCREVRIGGDLYQMGILIPTNDVSYERSTQGYERILIVWKNGEHHAHYYLPHHAIVREVKVRGTQISVRYLQVEDFVSDVKREKNVEQTFAVDFTYRIYAPVKITNWLDYYMDGLGNIHAPECCKDKFSNL